MQNGLLDDFLKEVENRGLKLHGIQIIKNEETIAKHNLKKDIARNIFSVSKSFLVTAVGILIDEERLNLKDRPIDFFPEYLTKSMNPLFYKLNLHHLLTMSGGFKRTLLFEDEREKLKGEDWLRFILNQTIVDKPGTRFMYNNACSFLAGCMVEMVCNMKLIDYLEQKVFKILNIPYPKWIESPMGHTFAASGLEMKLSDYIKLGVLYLNNGEYDKKRIISKNWVDMATSQKIKSGFISAGVQGSDELYGYGYQFWMSRFPKIYRAYGRNGQYVIVIPQKNSVIATSAFEVNAQGILDLIWQTILPKL